MHRSGDAKTPGRREAAPAGTTILPRDALREPFASGRRARAGPPRARCMNAGRRSTTLLFQPSDAWTIPGDLKGRHTKIATSALFLAARPRRRRQPRDAAGAQCGSPNSERSPASASMGRRPEPPAAERALLERCPGASDRGGVRSIAGTLGAARSFVRTATLDGPAIGPPARLRACRRAGSPGRRRNLVRWCGDAEAARRRPVPRSGPPPVRPSPGDGSVGASLSRPAAGAQGAETGALESARRGRSMVPGAGPSGEGRRHGRAGFVPGRRRRGALVFLPRPIEDRGPGNPDARREE
jgi:hypothetical protein